MRRWSLINNRLKFKISGKSPIIILEDSIEYVWNQCRKNPKTSTCIITSRTRISTGDAPKSPDTAQILLYSPSLCQVRIELAERLSGPASCQWFNHRLTYTRRTSDPRSPQAIDDTSFHECGSNKVKFLDPVAAECSSISTAGAANFFKLRIQCSYTKYDI